ncbi:pimeloyl-ACP methyl ester esterase BioH [Rheinheimera texasensis]|jgi:pimeloyl-[acyl-carrier protein] methyl ester esterase|uniref:pimeloyl-ACP methyl ester esterase BioH n=1 Tax=Rheinheimera texasensis TaxID=306205 RepID=UPI0004E139CC|nr:pimeloyl-ACP methyl ester esterase BioH [Rheinheimera texasensis]
MTLNAENTKPTVVLIHGWGLNHAIWQPVADVLAAEYQVLALDLPGYGLATNYPEPYSLAAITDQLAAQIPAQSFVLGWSLGGLVATQLALRHPAKVRSLALVASSPCFLQQPDWPGMNAQVMQQFAGSLSANLALTVERFLAIQAMGSDTARHDIKQLKQAVLSLPLPQAQVLAAGLEILATTDLRPELAKLSMPLFGCFGRLDSLVPVAMTTMLAELAPRAQISVLAKASHAPFISHQTEFLYWIRQCLQA